MGKHDTIKNYTDSLGISENTYYNAIHKIFQKKFGKKNADEMIEKLKQKDQEYKQNNK